MKLKSRPILTLLTTIISFLNIARAQSNLPPSIAVQPVSVISAPGSNVLFSVGVNGSLPLAYQWQFNNTNLPNGIIATVAGIGVTGFNTATNLSQPYAVAVDAHGNRYIADTGNGRALAVSASGVISTIAGFGTPSNVGLSRPSGIAVDSRGNVFIADTGNQRIRMVNSSGIISIVAGNGTRGYSGDGGSATNATLNSPFGVAVDAAENIYIGDGANGCVRKVTAAGIISTIAGNGTPGFAGDGGAATKAQLHMPGGVTVDSNGNLFIADAGNNRVRRVDTNGIITTVAGNGIAAWAGDGGPATNATLYSPAGVAVDEFGCLYIADTTNGKIRKVSADGLISTVVGQIQLGYSGDGGPATNAELSFVYGVATDPYGNIYIADSFNNRIREVFFQGPVYSIASAGFTDAGNYQVIITNAFGSVTSSVAALTLPVPPSILQQPVSAPVPPGTNVVFHVIATGALPLAYQWQCNGQDLGSGNYSGANSNTLIFPNPTVANAGIYELVVSNMYGSVTSSMVALRAGSPPVISLEPSDQTVSGAGTAKFGVNVSGTGPLTYQWQLNGTNLPNNIITTVAGVTGVPGFSGDDGAATNALLNRPRRVAVDSEDNLYIADTGNSRIRKVTAQGIITTVVGNGNIGFNGDGLAATNTSVFEPDGVLVDAEDEPLISDSANSRVRLESYGIEFTVAGSLSSGFTGDGGPAIKARMIEPEGLALDTEENIYIADTENSRIRKVDGNGIITTVAGNGTYSFVGDGGPATNASLNFPGGVAVDDLDNLFIADTDNQRIREVSPSGVITTIAGTGSIPSGASGDGGPATNAGLNYPNDLTVDSYGNLYIADNGNGRIRRINPRGIITTVAGGGNFGDGVSATNAVLYNPAGVAVDAAGNIFIADTGHSLIRRVTPQGPVFSIPSATLNNAGTYQLIVSSPYGSVTSTVATLTVTLPQISGVTVINGNMTFTLSTAPNVSSRILTATNLTPPVFWQPVYTNVAGTNGIWQFTDTNTSLNPIQFYRVSTP